MASITVIDFVSRNCKDNTHEKCRGKWQGFGFDIICICICHIKKEAALAEVEGPEARATDRMPSFKDSDPK